MAALDDTVLDPGLALIDANVENLYILSADPGLTFGNIATFALGNKATPTINPPSDRVGGGREIIVDAITDGVVTATGTATHFALVDDSASVILGTQALAAAQAVTNGNPFTLTQFVVAIPDPV